MKRTIILTLSFLLIFCSLSEAKKFTVGFVRGVEKGIQSGFILMASQGLFKARQDNGFTVITETPVDVTQESMAAAFRKMIDKKPDLIMATGYQMAEHVRKFAPLNPEILFLMNDIPIKNISNVMSIQFDVHEASFLAGLLSGLMSKTGTVGVIGGVNIPPVIAFITGFKEGVRYANPDVQVKEAYITKLPDFSGFSSPKKGAELAQKWYSQETDIIFAVAGTTGNGVIQQAKKNNKYVIGVDTDQDDMAKGHVLTSVIKQMDVAVYLAINQILEGKFKSGPKNYGLKENGVGLTEMKYTKHLIPDTVLKQLKDAKQKIISGELKISGHIENN